MTAKEWLDTIKQAKDYNPQMTVLIEKYGEMLLDESFESIKKDVARQLNTHVYDKKLLVDYGVKIQEYLLNPPFILEHSQHALACEKLADVRESFLGERYDFHH